MPGSLLPNSLMPVLNSGSRTKAGGHSTLCAITVQGSIGSTPTSFLVLSSVSTMEVSFREAELVWQPYSALSTVMEARYGLKVQWEKERRSTLSLARAVRVALPWMSPGDVRYSQRKAGGENRMNHRRITVILLVEDNRDDEALTLRALNKNNIKNEVVVAHDGVEALDFLFGTGSHAGRELNLMPTVILLDLKLPKVDGLEVLRRVRAHGPSRLLPIVILTSS